MEGAYYDTAGRVIARPGTFMFNAPGAIHGGISCDLTLYIHCCSGEPNEIVSDGVRAEGTVGAFAHIELTRMYDGSQVRRQLQC